MKIHANFAGEIILSEVFCGVGIETDMGTFGVYQRDGGIEVLFAGATVWNSHQLPGGAEENVHQKRYEEVVALLRGVSKFFGADHAVNRYLAAIDLEAAFPSGRKRDKG